MICPWRDLENHRVDRGGMLSVAFADARGLGWRPQGDGYQHHAREPYGSIGSALATTPGDKAFHLQTADRGRLLAKHAWYKMMEVVSYPGRRPIAAVDAMYNKTPNEHGLVVEPIPVEWWGGYDKGLIKFEMETWFARECLRLMNLYGPGTFEGLNLFGVV